MSSDELADKQLGLLFDLLNGESLMNDSEFRIDASECIEQYLKDSRGNYEN